MKSLQELYIESHATLSTVAKKSGYCISTIQRYVNGKIRFPNKEYEETIRNVLEEMSEIHNVDVKVNTDVKKDEVVGTDNKTSNETSNETDNINETKHETDNDNYENEIDTNELKEQMNRNSVSINHHNTSGFGTYTVTSRAPKRSEIWYIKPSMSTVGKELWSGSQNRPCIVIQSNKLNNSGTCVIVYLTKQVREYENPALVSVQTNVTSTAICNQINTVSITRFVNCVGTITELEMSSIERALLTVLDIKVNAKSEIQHVPDYLIIKSQLEVYKRFYEDYIRIKSIK